MSGQIFISYRREESGWSARSLHDRLAASFDLNQIFMDIDAIALGEDFIKAIKRTVAKCDVLIAVIGNNWLTSKDDQGDRRLDNPEDFVRMEIVTALSRDIRVIPVLVDGAMMPRSTELPDDLKGIVRRNALQISQSSFGGDCQRLVAAIRQVLEEAATEEQEREKKRRDAELREREERERLDAERPAEGRPGATGGSSRSGGRSPSKYEIYFLAAVVVGALIYYAIKSSNSPLPQPAPVVPVTASPLVIATPIGAEVTIKRLTFKVVAMQLDSHKKDKPTLRFTIRMTNKKDLTGANFIDNNCRLVIDGVARAPISGLNEIVASHSSMDADFIFLIPTGTRSAALEFWVDGESETIPVNIPSE